VRENKSSPESVYKAFAEYYDAYVAGFEADFEIYLRLLKPGLTVLEIGCGTGRVLKPLLESGAVVLGVDISHEMLGLAHNKLASFCDSGALRLLNHNFVYSSIQEEFDRVFVTFYTFNYLLSYENALLFLKNIYSSMNDGAVLLMDMFFPSIYHNPAIEGKWQERLLNLGEKQIRLSDRRTMRGSVEKREQVFEEDGGRQEITTLRRFYDKNEMARLLREAGFLSIKFTDVYDSSLFHQLEPLETTDCSFLVMARRESGQGEG
jgi:SAM-dependent methyltransferase